MADTRSWPFAVAVVLLDETPDFLETGDDSLLCLVCCTGATERFAALATGRAIREATAGAVVEEAVVVVGERSALLLLDQAVLFLTGWKVVVFITIIQMLIWCFSDNDLQT